MRAEDELVVMARQFADDAPSTTESVRDVLIKTVVNTALPLGIGSAITGLMSSTADHRWRERVNELFVLFAERVSKLVDVIDSQDYYASEEFQALLSEAIDQERTNRYDEKRKMLAQGLANSGTRAHSQRNEKEVFFRILRDLSPTDIALLRGLTKPLEGHRTTVRVAKAKNVSSVVYRLQGLGLVSTTQRLPVPRLGGVKGIQDQGALNKFIADALGAEPDVAIEITSSGRNFLAFLCEEPITIKRPAPVDSPKSY